MPHLSSVLGIILLVATSPGVWADEPPAVAALSITAAPAGSLPSGDGNGPARFPVNAWVAVRPNTKLNDGKTEFTASSVPMRYHIDKDDPSSSPRRVWLSGDVAGWAKETDLLSPEEELAAFAELIRQFPFEPELYMRRGVVEIETRGFTQAIADFDEALRLNPSLALAYYHRSIANVQTHHLERALGDLYEAIRLEPRNPSVYLGQAEVAKALKLRSRAIEDYTTVLRLAPQNEQAKKGLAQLLSPSSSGGSGAPVPAPHSVSPAPIGIVPSASAPGAAPETPPPPAKTTTPDVEAPACPEKPAVPSTPSPLQKAFDQAGIAEANARTAEANARTAEARARIEKALLDAEGFRRQRPQSPTVEPSKEAPGTLQKPGEKPKPVDAQPVGEAGNSGAKASGSNPVTPAKGAEQPKTSQ
jgi:tetratricopeptide (TPR) repeat protein